jgi:putative sugar O-methyltransferase
MRVLIFGTGSMAFGIEAACRSMDYEIVAFLDNDAARRTAPRGELPVLSPEDGIKLDYDHIFTASSFHDEMVTQLVALGVPSHRISKARTSPEWAGGKLSFRTYTVDRETENLHTQVHTFALGDKVVDEVATTLSPDEHRDLVHRLFVALRRALDDAADVPPVYRVGRNWKAFLEATRPSFVEALRDDDEAACEELLRNFCRNELSTGILGGREAYEDFCRTDLRSGIHELFKIWSYSIGRAPVGELASPPIGNPYGYAIDGHNVHPNTFLNHARACMIEKMVEEIASPCIAEIGGGFGGLGYYLTAKIPAVRYVNFDLPENLLIASYYLSCAYPHKKIHVYQGGEDLAEIISTNDITLLPNFMLPKMPDLGVDVFVNTISLSEMNYATIGEYLSQIERVCRKYFYHENVIDSCAEFPFFPIDVFPSLPSFTELTRRPSRWPFFSHTSHQHCHSEQLLVRKGSSSTKA